MKLCYLRHGEADWPNWDKPDDERPLTERGRKEMKRVAKFLERLKFSADAILTSPLPRASQTAEIVAQRLGIELKTDSALAHGFNVERLRRLLGKADADRSEEHTSELQSPCNLVCRLLLEKKKK